MISYFKIKIIKMVSGAQSMPKDLQAMTNILKDFGIVEYEHSVLNQMLEFTYRYVTSIVEDAVIYSTHAKKKAIDGDDVKLAICLQQDKYFTGPPSREVTAALARARNGMPLPLIRSSAGLRLPPDRHALISCNFNLKPAAKKARTVHTVSRLNLPQNMAQNTVAVPRPSFIQKAAPNPIIKFSEGNKMPIQVSTLSPMSTTTLVSSMNSIPTNHLIMPTVGVIKMETQTSNEDNKRVHEDDDYDN